jgi:hypothetical protein
LCGRDGIEFRHHNSSVAQRGLRHRDQIAEMFPRREFGHHPTVLRMKFDLGGNHIGEDMPGTDDGHAGFIAGSFKREQSHGKSVQRRFKGEA